MSRDASLWPGAPYDYCRSANGLVFTAGACPLDENGELVGDEDLGAQAAQAAANLLRALAEADLDAAALLKTTVYVVADGRRDLVRVWDVVSEHLGRAPSTLLGVAFLGYPGQLVEVEGVAATAER